MVVGIYVKVPVSDDCRHGPHNGGRVGCYELIMIAQNDSDFGSF